MGLRGQKGRGPVKPLPAGLLDADTWTIPCGSVLLLLMEDHTTAEAVYLWGSGLGSIAVRKDQGKKRGNNYSQSDQSTAA